MPTRFRPYHPDQGLLLPPDMRDWLPGGHLAHHVSDLVDGLDLTVFYAPYEGDGRRKSPYEPRMMLKVLIYGYATGVVSSRGLARKLEEDVAFRVLAAGNFPSHRTICEFRRRHLGDFKRLFVEVVRLAAETGVANFGKLSIDGTKVRANASKRKAMSYGRMLEEERRLESEIEALLDRAGAVDAEEDARFGEDFRGDELPEELRRREDRLAAIRAAKERLEARQREADEARGRKPGMKRNPTMARTSLDLSLMLHLNQEIERFRQVSPRGWRPETIPPLKRAKDLGSLTARATRPHHRVRRQATPGRRHLAALRMPAHRCQQRLQARNLWSVEARHRLRWVGAFATVLLVGNQPSQYCARFHYPIRPHRRKYRHSAP